jgi:hypothetical protein
VCHRDFELTCTNNCVSSSWLWQDHIQKIRQNYTKDFRSKDVPKKQIAVATYLIDKLALRAGNEKVLSYWTYCLQWFNMMGQSYIQYSFQHTFLGNLSFSICILLWPLLTFITCYFNPCQDDDEADTVGCCTLKVDNVTCVPPNKLQVFILIVHSQWLLAMVK